MRGEEYTLALTKFEAAAHEQPMNYKISRCLGLCYMKQNRLEEAVDAFWKTIHLNPQDFIAYLNLGLIASKQGKEKIAINFIAKAISLVEEKIHRWYQRACSDLDQGSGEKAIAALRAASKLKLQHAMLRSKLEEVYYAHNLLELAMDEWHKILAPERRRPDRVH